MSIPEEELDDVVRDEDIVHSAFEEHKITTEEVEKIDDIEQLQAQSQTITAQNNTLSALDQSTESMVDNQSSEQLSVEQQAIMVQTDQIKTNVVPEVEIEQTQEQKELKKESSDFNPEIKNLK